MPCRGIKRRSSFMQSVRPALITLSTSRRIDACARSRDNSRMTPSFSIFPRIFAMPQCEADGLTPRTSPLFVGRSAVPRRAPLGQFPRILRGVRRSMVG
jgi:hypothetical protein